MWIYALYRWVVTSNYNYRTIKRYISRNSNKCLVNDDGLKKLKLLNKYMKVLWTLVFLIDDYLEQNYLKLWKLEDYRNAWEYWVHVSAQTWILIMGFFCPLWKFEMLIKYLIKIEKTTAFQTIHKSNRKCEIWYVLWQYQVLIIIIIFFINHLYMSINQEF